MEGVLGPGAANNSSLGGNLVTTIAFGVPASVSTAILMGAFLIQGLVPGPAMLTPEPKGFLSVTFAMVWTIVISNIITVAFCFLLLNQLVKITQVRGALLTPFILTLIYVDAFAEKNVFQDLWVVLVYGGLGWVMAKLGWPRPPLLLGLVLGPLAENKLFLSTGNYGLAWLARPGVLILLVIMAGGLLYPFWSTWRRWHSEVRTVPSPEPARRDRRLDRTTAFTLLIVVLFAWALWQSRNFGIRAGLFPWAVGFPGLALAIVQLARELTGRRDQTSALSAFEDASEVPPALAARRTIEVCAWTVGYLAAIWLVGFSLATLVTTFFYLKICARERWPMTLAMTLFGFAFVWGVFEKVLGVPFPPGRVFVWLGLGNGS